MPSCHCPPAVQVQHFEKRPRIPNIQTSLLLLLLRVVAGVLVVIMVAVVIPVIIVVAVVAAVAGAVGDSNGGDSVLEAFGILVFAASYEL